MCVGGGGEYTSELHWNHRIGQTVYWTMLCCWFYSELDLSYVVGPTVNWTYDWSFLEWHLCYMAPAVN